MGERDLKTSGLLPYRVWIGVTGHRNLDPTPQLAGQVRRVLDRIRMAFAATVRTPVEVGVVSGLAEGADRIVARIALEDGGAVLEAALPLARDDYLADFAGAESKREFDELLARASVVRVLARPGDDREAAYARQGEYLVGRVDVLIAVWDGQPARGRGGTAEVVALARERHLNLVRIDPAGAGPVPFEPEDLVVGAGLRDIEAYNRSAVNPATVRDGRRDLRETLQREARRADLPGEAIDAVLAWGGLAFIRADSVAGNRQRRYLLLSQLVLILGAAAVAVVALISLFARHPRLATIEALTLVAALLLVYTVRRRKLHWWWIHSRVLAERLRAALFLAIVVSTVEAAAGRPLREEDPSTDWVSRAVEELWLRRPTLHLDGVPPEAIKRFVLAAWIRDQQDYYLRASRRHERQDSRLTIAMTLLFGLALLLAVFDALVFGMLQARAAAGLEEVILFSCLVLPAFAGVVSGIQAQGEHMRSAHRFRAIARQLEVAGGAIARAPTPEALYSATRGAAALMFDEHQQWFGVMEFHDVELHV